MNFKEKFLRNLVKNWPAFFNKKKIKSEYLTIFRITFGILTALVLAQGQLIFSIFFLFLYQIVLLLDYVDGELARLQKRFSIRWLHIDRIFHYIVTSLLFVGLAYSSHNNYYISISLISVLAFLIVGLVDTKNTDARLGKIKQKKSKLKDLASFLIIESPFSLFFFLIIFNFVKTTIIIYSLFYFFGFLYKVIKSIK